MRTGRGRRASRHSIRPAMIVAIGLLLAACSSAPATPSPEPGWTARADAGPDFGPPFEGAFTSVTAGVAYGEGFVLVGRVLDDERRWFGGIWTSPDGTSWSRIGQGDPIFDDAYMTKLATDGHRLVALGWAAPWPDGRRGPYAAWISDDGATWERHDIEATILGGVFVDGLVGTRFGFFAWGQREDLHGLLLRSDDGLKWEAIDYPSSGEANVTGLAVFGGGLLAIGAKYQAEVIAHGPNPAARAWWSADGRAWQQVAIGGYAPHGVFAGANGVLVVGPTECSACVGNRHAWQSSDGRSWSGIGEEPWLYPFVASNGRQIASFDWQGGRTISLSVDGRTWSPWGASIPAADYDAGMIVGSTGVLLLPEQLGTDADCVQTEHAGVLFLRGS